MKKSKKQVTIWHCKVPYFFATATLKQNSLNTTGTGTKCIAIKQKKNRNTVV
jgi:hypothetical protein